MLIEINEYDLEGKDLYQTASYPSPGLYLINDGIAYNLILVPEQGNGLCNLPVPLEQVKKHIAKESALETEKDLSDRIFKRIADIYECVDEINKQLEEMKQQQNLQVPQVYQSEKVDGETLLKALAIAQNPELSVKLLTGEE